MIYYVNNILILNTKYEHLMHMTEEIFDMRNLIYFL